MKKILPVCLLLFILLLGFTSCKDNVQENDEIEDSKKSFSVGLNYGLDSDTQSYHVVGIGTCTDTDIVIPSSYNGLPVTEISGRAFIMCKNLTSVTIPDTVVSIGINAFYGCENLTSIVIPDSVTFISSGAFAGCARAFEIENGVSYIGKWVIDCDDSVTNAVIRDGTLGIANMAFCSNTSLTSITVPDSVAYVCWGAFERCTSLTSITVGVNNQFYQSIDGNLYTKDGKTFLQYATGKTDSEFAIPNGVTSIGGYAFSYCTALTSITIPDSVTVIGFSAFEGCTSLFSLTIPDSVTSIERFAFYDCTSLTRIFIPKSVKSIGAFSFDGCMNLNVCFEAELSELELIDVFLPSCSLEFGCKE